jgi:hypothetical protein
MADSKVLSDLQKAGQQAARENALRGGIAKASTFAVMQIEEAKRVCAEQKLGTDTDTVLRVAQIISTNWAALD